MAENDSKNFLMSKLSQGPLDSKKFISGIAGLICILFVWLGSAIGIFIKTEMAAHYVTLATMVVPFIFAIVGGMLTGQMLFDSKAMNSIQKVDDNDKEEKIAGIQNGNGKNH